MRTWRVVEVVAPQVSDTGDHPALDERQPGDVRWCQDGGRDQPTEVGDEATEPGIADVVLDHLVDPLSTLLRCSRSCASAPRGPRAATARRRVARCSASRTKDEVRPGASSVSFGTTKRTVLIARPCFRAAAHAQRLGGPRETGCGGTSYRHPRWITEAGRAAADAVGAAFPRAACCAPHGRRPGRDRRRPRARERCWPPTAGDVPDAGAAAAPAEGLGRRRPRGAGGAR